MPQSPPCEHKGLAVIGDGQEHLRDSQRDELGKVHTSDAGHSIMDGGIIRPILMGTDQRFSFAASAPLARRRLRSHHSEDSVQTVLSPMRFGA